MQIVSTRTAAPHALHASIHTCIYTMHIRSTSYTLCVLKVVGVVVSSSSSNMNYVSKQSSSSDICYVWLLLITTSTTITTTSTIKTTQVAEGWGEVKGTRGSALACLSLSVCLFVLSV